jgi:hypothetical protein
MAQEHHDLEISRLYFNVAIECFDKAALQEDADGAEIFRRMGRRYISEAEFYDATIQQKLAGRPTSPQLRQRIGASPRPHGPSIISRHQLARDGRRSNPAAGAVPDQRRALAMLATTGRNGVTQTLLTAHGFSVSIIGGLVNQGLVTITGEQVKAAGKMIEVGKVRITEAGRRAIVAST